MQVVILAGGKGTRLIPHTSEIPKPLVSVGNKPIIEILLYRLKKSGVKKVTIAVNHLAHLIQTVLGDGHRFGIEVDYSLEDEPLSTVAPLKLIKDLPDNFMVANGDTLTDLNFRKFFEYHLEKKAVLTIATHQRVDRIDFGVLETEKDGTVVKFMEKPEIDLTVSMGIYAFSKEVLNYIPDGTPFGFDELVLKLLKEKVPVNTFPFDGYWLDINRPDDYARANREIEFVNSLLD